MSVYAHILLCVWGLGCWLLANGTSQNRCRVERKLLQPFLQPRKRFLSGYASHRFSSSLNASSFKFKELERKRNLWLFPLETWHAYLYVPSTILARSQHPRPQTQSRMYACTLMFKHSPKPFERTLSPFTHEWSCNNVLQLHRGHPLCLWEHPLSVCATAVSFSRIVKKQSPTRTQKQPVYKRRSQSHKA